MDKPSDALAKRIADRLAQEGLITVEAANKAQSAIASGTMSAEDWQLPIELAAEKQEEEAQS